MNKRQKKKKGLLIIEKTYSNWGSKKKKSTEQKEVQEVKENKVAEEIKEEATDAEKMGKKIRAAAAAWRALCGPDSLARCARCLLRGRHCLRSQACSLAAGPQRRRRGHARARGSTGADAIDGGHAPRPSGGTGGPLSGPFADFRGDGCNVGHGNFSLSWHFDAGLQGCRHLTLPLPS